ncbi:hypothetical protein JRO89_XS09G0043700 [Xanthoceras sorbifolium]|uniref:RNase H type-1 domain-containing protein n=1 Tax=Xanthoceras sorbifolium TaxID=99658 RepID=A0ABQ8HKL7_9ROSI|nr:hypothetical protein JRO89_XS09G0043700 [Xanthoceras sorbifolium]
MESLEIIKKSLLSARSMSIGSSESDGKATASGKLATEERDNEINKFNFEGISSTSLGPHNFDCACSFSSLAGAISGCKSACSVFSPVGAVSGYRSYGVACRSAGAVFRCRSTGVIFGYRFARAVCMVAGAVAGCSSIEADKGSGRFGLGMVVRQEGGDVVLAATLPLKEGIVVAVAETRAVLEGLVLADSKGFTLC